MVRIIKYFLTLFFSKTSSNDCARAILHQLTLIKFVREEHGLLELANAELGFFLKTDNIAQSVGLKLQVTVAGGDQVGS